MDGCVDALSSEVGILRRKLQSKAEALIILTKELEQCRTERDQLKLIAERSHNHILHKKTFDDKPSSSRLVKYNDISEGSSTMDHYLEVREHNKALRLEIQDLKQKLRDAYGDIKVLRAGTAEGSRVNCAKDIAPAHQREELVEQLERMGGRVSQLEADLRSLLDEKEELVSERETYRCKVHRLNYQINKLLRCESTSGKLIDIDALVMDNRYLHEQMQQLKTEKEMAHQALLKYKSMLERKRNKGMVKLGTPSSTVVVTHKQVQELLQQGSIDRLPNTEATLSDLRSLCVALLEGLQDKSLALTHQRKANKILAGRISELEHRLGANVPVFPSDLLLQGYSSTQIDADLDKLTLDFDSRKNDIAEATSDSQDSRDSSEPYVNGFSDNNDSLPEDIQELVNKALEEIREESQSSQH